MMYFSTLITFLITFFLLFLVSLSSNLIQDSCENAAKNDPNLSYEFCVASLEANPRSQNATLQELVIISLGLTISNAKNISSHIEQLLSLKSFDKHTKIGLQDCLELYSDAHSTLLEAMENVKLKDYEGANVEISSAMDASTTCEDGLKEKKVSHATNIQGLALIAMELALENATNTISSIEKLLTSRTFDPFARACLEDCFKLYSHGVVTLIDATGAFLTGQYSTANVWLSAVMEGATTCEEGFPEKEGELSPLTKENYYLFQLCDIALCIIHLLSLPLHS
ncbi:hypothetical protein WN943_019291 [Citrus x changshan-huyou]